MLVKPGTHSDATARYRRIVVAAQSGADLDPDEATPVRVIDYRCPTATVR